MNNTSLAWLKEEKKYQKCPSCNKGFLSQRIKSFKIYKLIPLIKAKRYKCDNCEKTLHLFTRK